MENSQSTAITVDQLNQLIQVVGKINSRIQLEALLIEIMEAVKLMMNTEASSLFLLSEDGAELILHTPSGPSARELTHKRIPSDAGLSGWVLKHNKPLLVNDVQNDDRFVGEIAGRYNHVTRNLVCVPLIDHMGATVGVLQAVNSKNGYLSQDLVPLFEMLAHQAAIAIETAKLLEERTQKEVMDKELELAQSIQTGFWPIDLPDVEGYQFTGMSKPASSIGGDYFDYIRIDDSSYGFAIADVTGKGVAASLLMATMRASLRSHVENVNDVVECLKRVNRLIYKDTPSNKFITAVFGQLDHNNHTFTYVNAGHNPPYLLRAADAALIPLEAGGVMLGIMDPMHLSGSSVSLEPGDKIVMFTDGITEATNTNEEYYSDEAFEQWLLENRSLSPKDMQEQLLESITTFANGQVQSDDITLVIIEREEGR